MSPLQRSPRAWEQNCRIASWGWRSRGLETMMSRSPNESFPGGSGGMETVRKYSWRRGRMDLEREVY